MSEPPMSPRGNTALPDGAVGTGSGAAREELHLYLSHVEDGRSIRALARDMGCHASTVLRRVRRLEARRDDPLIDEALARAGQDHAATGANSGDASMGNELRAVATEAAFDVLAHLAEPGAILAVAPEMERAAVLMDGIRRAVVDRTLLQQIAVSDWITLERRKGRVLIYTLSSPGRAALRRAQDRGGKAMPTAIGSGFSEQHRIWAERAVPAPEDGRLRRQRVNLAESPLGVLARRRDREGQPFLGPELVAAGERLREDFELAQLGPRVAQNWERFLTTSDRGAVQSGGGPGGGSAAARDRVAAALRALGPGLGDVVLRCCCYLEGVEAAEQRMGWSARSGKVVLRIGLIQLSRYYHDTYGTGPRLIG